MTRDEYEDRNRRLVLDLQAGMPQSCAAKKYGITRERVRQLNDAAGLPKGRLGILARGEARRAEREADRGEKMRAWRERLRLGMMKRWEPRFRAIIEEPGTPMSVLAKRFGYRSAGAFTAAIPRAKAILGVELPNRRYGPRVRNGASGRVG